MRLLPCTGLFHLYGKETTSSVYLRNYSLWAHFSILLKQLVIKDYAQVTVMLMLIPPKVRSGSEGFCLRHCTYQFVFVTFAFLCLLRMFVVLKTSRSEMMAVVDLL